MLGLPSALLAMASSHSLAMVTSRSWDKIYLGDSCLTTNANDLYNGAPVYFTDCEHSGDFFMDFPSDTSQPFTIHVGTLAPDETSPRRPNGLLPWCLDAVGIDSNSSLVTIWECNGSAQQNFKLSDSYNISGDMPYTGNILLSDGKCLDGTHATAGNVPTGQVCIGSDEQIWGHCRSSHTSSPYYNYDSSNCARDTTTPAPAPAPIDFQIHSTASMLCVDLPDGDTTNGALLWTWECSGMANQQFSFSDGQLVYLPDTSKCVDLLGGDTTNGNLLGLWDCYNGDSQLWGFDPDMGTIYLASSVESDATKCAQISGSNAGDNLAIWDCNGAQDQVWTLDLMPPVAAV